MKQSGSFCFFAFRERNDAKILTFSICELKLKLNWLTLKNKKSISYPRLSKIMF